MFSSLVRGLGRKGHRHKPASITSNPDQSDLPQRFANYEDDEEARGRLDENSRLIGSYEHNGQDEQEEEEDEEDIDEADPLLPIFSAAHLGILDSKLAQRHELTSSFQILYQSST